MPASGPPRNCGQVGVPGRKAGRRASVRRRPFPRAAGPREPAHCPTGLPKSHKVHFRRQGARLGVPGRRAPCGIPGAAKHCALEGPGWGRLRPRLRGKAPRSARERVRAPALKARGPRPRRQCRAAGAARPHVLRARGVTLRPRGLRGLPPGSSLGSGPAPRTSGGPGTSAKPESRADLGPQQEGGHRVREIRRAGTSREEAPKKGRGRRERAGQPGTGKRCALRVSDTAPEGF